MGTFDNIYLNKIKKLQEENFKLKQIINEVYGPGAYPNPNDMRAVDRVYLKDDDLEPMDELEDDLTPEELIDMYGEPGRVNLRDLSPKLQRLLGAAHARHPKHSGRIPAGDLDNFQAYAAGVRSVEPKLH